MDRNLSTMRSFALSFLILFCLPSFGQNNEKSPFDVAYTLFQQKKYAEALPLFQDMLKERPENVSLLELTGFCLGETGKPGAAASLFSTASQAQPETNSFYINAGYYFMQALQLDSAEQYLKKALYRNPDDYNNYLNLGHVYFLKGKASEANYYYGLSSEFMPHDSTLLNSVVSDLKKTERLKPEWTTRDVESLFRDDFKMAGVNLVSNRILDSIYRLVSSENASNSLLEELKERFISVNMEEPIRRLKVIRNFAYDLAFSYYSKGDQKKAINSYFKAALNLDNYLKDSLSVFQAYLRFSKVALQRSRATNKWKMNDDALFMAENALKVADSFQLKEERPFALLQLALNYYELDSFHQAISWYKKTMESSPRITVEEKALLLKQIMNSFALLQKWDSAEYYYERIGRLSRELHKANAIILEVQESYIGILYAKGKEKEALQKATQLLKLSGEMDLDDQSNLLRTMGLCHFYLGNKDSGYYYMERSVNKYKEYCDHFVKIKPGLRPPLIAVIKANDIGYLREKAGSEKNAPGLFRSMEGSKESFFQYILTSDPYLKDTISLEKVQRELKEEEIALSYADMLSPTAWGVAIVKNSSQVGIHKIKDLEKIINNDPRGKEILKQLKTISADFSSQVALPLSFYLNCSRNTTASRGVLPISVDTAGVKDPDSLRAAVGKALYRYYMEPYEKLLEGKKRIYLSADALQHYIPFEALQDKEGRYMGDKYEIIYVPSFSIRYMLQDRGFTNADKAIIFGNPSYSNYHPEKHGGRAYDYSFILRSNWEDLPGTAKEVKAISEILKGSSIVEGKRLSESEIKKMNAAGEFKNAGLLHFALHGFTNLNKGYQDNAMILTEPDEGTEDGFLQFNEIVALDIKARLVCLSACETSFGMPNEDGSSLSLASAFLMSGAAACIGTNWKIADQPSMLFMSALYSLIQKGDSPSHALFEVRKKFISGEMGEQYKNPYYWAPFKYYGL